MEKRRQKFAASGDDRAGLARGDGAANDTHGEDDLVAAIVLVDPDGKCATDGTPIQILWRLRHQEAREALLAAIRAVTANEGSRAIPIWLQERGLVLVRPAAERGYAMVTLRRPGWSLRALTPEVIRTSFGASPAEAEIALMLAHGATAAEVATLRRVRKDTVRSQIKSLMRKVGVRTRSSLTISLIEVGAEFSWSSPIPVRPR